MWTDFEGVWLNNTNNFSFELLHVLISIFYIAINLRMGGSYRLTKLSLIITIVFLKYWTNIDLKKTGVKYTLCYPTIWYFNWMPFNFSGYKLLLDKGWPFVLCLLEKHYIVLFESLLNLFFVVKTVTEIWNWLVKQLTHSNTSCFFVVKTVTEIWNWLVKKLTHSNTSELIQIIVQYIWTAIS